MYGRRTHHLDDYTERIAYTRGNVSLKWYFLLRL